MNMPDASNDWLAEAPQDVRITTERLLAEVDAMRAEQVIYPPQDAILRALSLTAPANVRVVILGPVSYTHLTLPTKA